jgi:hypothetical protein
MLPASTAQVTSQLQCIDRLFSTLPLLLFSYHFLLEAAAGCQFQIVRTAVLNCILSSIIKSVVRQERRKKSCNFVSWKLIQRFECLKSNYGFPSTHAIFYAGYFFDVPTTSTLFLMLAGCSSRVIYQHHTAREVCSSIALALFLKILSSWVPKVLKLHYAQH